jgi:hypothetical protein
MKKGDIIKTNSLTIIGQNIFNMGFVQPLELEKFIYSLKRGPHQYCAQNYLEMGLGLTHCVKNVFGNF